VFAGTTTGTAGNHRAVGRNRPELPKSPYHGMQRRPYMPAGAGVAALGSVPPARHRRGLDPSSRFPA